MSNCMYGYIIYSRGFKYKMADSGASQAAETTGGWKTAGVEIARSYCGGASRGVISVAPPDPIPLLLGGASGL